MTGLTRTRGRDPYNAPGTTSLSPLDAPASEAEREVFFMSAARTAVEWLVAVAPDPGACRRAWERDPLGVTLLPAGRSWDVLILPGELGCPTLDVLT